MTGQIIKLLSLPENVFVIAALETLVMVLLILVIGALAGLFNKVLNGLLFRLTGSRAAFIICNYLTFPGTVHHELSHALMAFLTGAKIKSIKFFPDKKALGSVEIVPRGNIFLSSLQLSLSSAAPVIFGVLSLSASWKLIYPGLKEIWHYILFWYLFFCILMHMTMSSEDRRVFIRGLIPSIILLYLVFLGLACFGILI